MLFRCRSRRFTNDELSSILQELSDEERNLELHGDENFDFSDDSDAEDSNIIEDQHSSDSEQSADDEMDEIVSNTQEFEVFMGQGKKCEEFWLSSPLALPSKTKARNIIKVLPGPKRVARDAKSEIDCFLKLFSIPIIDKIVQYSNIFIEKRLSSGRFSRPREYGTTSRTEVMALLGILFMLSINKGCRADARRAWKSNGTGLMICRAAFGINRFRFLLQSLRFDDINSRVERVKLDKLAAIREVYSELNDNFQSSYSLSEFVTIDEMLHPFRGRCSFVMYMPNKPAKYGLKLYSMCDAKTYYVYNFEIYCGMQVPGPFAVSNKAIDVVKRLVEPIKNSNRNLTTDNYYTSYELAMYLLDNGITLLGTMKKNKPQIPREFLASRNRETQTSLFGFQDTCSLVSYVPKQNKAVILLSTLHDSAEIDPETRKPAMILDYNSTKGGVDTVDQKCANYSTKRKTRRWPLALFFRFLDMAGVNAYVIYVANNITNNEAKKSRMEFLESLAFSLLHDHFKSRANTKNLPLDVKAFLSRYREEPAAIQAPVQARSGPCHECGKHRNNKTTVRCSECQRFVCRNHSFTKVACHSCTAHSSDDE